ncbi:hypothetical protein DFH27DRAFT_652196 [Peziza echinospora]|nr:hypothetical protein DFH27DRAFT_652196 [Peziza echinospora]
MASRTSRSSSLSTGREKKCPPKRLINIAAAIVSYLRKNKRSESDQLLFSEAAGILDYLPSKDRDRLFSDRTTRNSSTASLSKDEITTFRRLRKDFFDGIAIKLSPSPENQEDSPSCDNTRIPSIDDIDSDTKDLFAPPNFHDSSPSFTPSAPPETDDLVTSGSGSSTPVYNSPVRFHSVTGLTAQSDDPPQSTPPTTTKPVSFLPAPPTAVVRIVDKPKSVPDSDTHDVPRIGKLANLKILEDRQAEKRRLENISEQQEIDSLKFKDSVDSFRKWWGAIPDPTESNLVPSESPTVDSVHGPVTQVDGIIPGHFPSYTPHQLPHGLQPPAVIKNTLSTQLTAVDESRRKADLSSEVEPLKSANPEGPVKPSKHSLAVHHAARGKTASKLATTSKPPAAANFPTLAPHKPPSNSSSASQPSQQHSASTHYAPSKQQSTAVPTTPALDVENMTPDEMKALIEATVSALLNPVIADIQTLKAATQPSNNPLDNAANPRQLEMDRRKAALEKELEDINAGRWTANEGRISSSPAPSGTMGGRESNMSPYGATGHTFRTRFDPAHLPKFRDGDDLDTWITEMNIDVTNFGEKLVCPMIYKHCFEVGSSMREWYLMLNAGMVSLMTEGDGCWRRFIAKMRDTWDRPLATRQKMADERHKLPNELFATYFYAKLKLLKAAYPECEDVTHIARIRAGLGDAEADLYIRERSSLIDFANECRQYDEHTKIHPKRQRFGQSIPQSNQTPASNKPQSTQPPQRAQSTGRPARVDSRAASLMDRYNPEAKKNQRSFLRKDGTPVFLERSCAICDKLGHKNEMHFSFECPLKSTIKTLIAEGIDEDEDHLPGVASSPHTTKPTSYRFKDAFMSGDESDESGNY